MNLYRSFSLLLLLLSVTSLQVLAQQVYHIQTGGAQMEVVGTSNLHDWECEVENVSGTATITLAEETLTAISALEVVVEVESIKSGKTQMDKNTYKAMKADQYPKLRYTLTKVSSIQAVADGWALQTTGRMTLAGKTNTIALAVQAKKGSNGQLIFSGSIPIHMPDYDIEPPSALLGTITTGADVSVPFTLPMILSTPN